MSDGEIVIVVPWVPGQTCNPNNHHFSERSKIRHRKRGAVEAGYPMKIAYTEATNDGSGIDWGPLFLDPVVLDIEVRWGYRQRSWDDDNLVTAYKYVRDALQTHQIVQDDKNVRIGRITQVRAKEQPETILTIRRAA